MISGGVIVNGGTGNDDIFGSEGIDILNGDAGNDEINGLESDDDVNGGPGQDTCFEERARVSQGLDGDTFDSCEVLLPEPV